MWNSILESYHRRRLLRSEPQALRAIAYFARRYRDPPDSSPMFEALRHDCRSVRIAAGKVIGRRALPALIDRSVVSIRDLHGTSGLSARLAEAFAEFTQVDASWFADQKVIEILPSLLDKRRDAARAVATRILDALPQAKVVECVLGAGADSSEVLCAAMQGMEARQLPRTMEILAAVAAAPDTGRVVLSGILALQETLACEPPAGLADLYFRSFLRCIAETLPTASGPYDTRSAVHELQRYPPGPAGARAAEMKAFQELLYFYLDSRTVEYEHRVVEHLIATDLDPLAIAADVVNCTGYVSHAEIQLCSGLPPERLGPSLSALLDRSNEHLGSRIVLAALAKAVLEPDSRLWSDPGAAEVVVARYLPQLRFGRHFIDRAMRILNSVADRLPAHLAQSVRSSADAARDRSYDGRAFGGVRKFYSDFAFDGLEDVWIVVAPWARGRYV
jgi:hypothetical protein